MAKIVIIIPTYNEAANTARMISELSRVVDSIKHHDLRVLYVDANSPDGTAFVVRDRQQTHSWLHLLVEERREGLGVAYARGMKHAMAELSADYLMEFDGDFQHRPADIFRLIAAIDESYDYVIGSRYVDGGMTPDDWGFTRTLLSTGGCKFGRTMLGLNKIRDITCGFKIARVKGFMDSFNFDALLSRSFAYKIHLLHYMVRRGASVKEVPITFDKRNAGETKMTWKETQETLKVIFQLMCRGQRSAFDHCNR
jgi:dolichol-phosphate mannosyltransferase